MKPEETQALFGTKWRTTVWNNELFRAIYRCYSRDNFTPSERDLNESIAKLLKSEIYIRDAIEKLFERRFVEI